MINPSDYKAGWTKSTINPKTGNPCSGGAARNLHLARQGGAEAVFNAGGITVLKQIAPLIEGLKTELKISRQLNVQMAKELQKARGKQRF